MNTIIAEQKLQEAILDHELLLIAPEDEVSEIWYLAWRAYEQTILSQSERVAWRQTVHVEEGGIKSNKYLYNDEKIMVDDDPLYLAPPSTEALQKDKAELIDYAKVLSNKYVIVALSKSVFPASL